MQPLPDGNYRVILTPEQAEAFENLIAWMDKVLPNVPSTTVPMDRMSPQDKARLDDQFRSLFGGDDETDECYPGRIHLP